MGLNGAFLDGVAAIDDCAPSGCAANGCSANCSKTSGYFLSYANHNVCGGSTKCTKQTGLPQGTGCGSSYGLFNSCSGQGVLGQLFECGPDPATRTSWWCRTASDGSLPVVACVTVRTFKALCGGCNPLTFGLIRLTITSHTARPEGTQYGPSRAS